MTGPEHWREAETCARAAANAYDSGSLEDGAAWASLGQIHATLALAAAVVDGPAVMRPEDRDEWDRATGRLEPGAKP
jgi:hypothetical protein